MTALIGFPTILALAAAALLASAFSTGRRKKIWRAAAAWCFVAGFGLLAWKSVAVTPSGVAHVETRFGRVAAAPLEPGFHIVHPFATLTPMTVRAVVFDWTEAGALIERDAAGDLTLVESAAQVSLDPAFAPAVYARIGGDADWTGLARRIIRASMAQMLSETGAQRTPAQMSERTLTLARATLTERLVAAGFTPDEAVAAIRIDGLDLVSVRPVVHGCARQLASL